MGKLPLINGTSSRTGFKISTFFNVNEQRVPIEAQTKNYQPDKELTNFQFFFFTALTIMIALILVDSFMVEPSSRYPLVNLFAASVQFAALFLFGGYSLQIIHLMFFPAENKRWHGCEHKTSDLLHKGLPLTEENLKKCSRVHRACGTRLIAYAWLMFAFLSFAPYLNQKDWFRLANTDFSLFFFLFFVLTWRYQGLLLSIILQYLFTTAEPTREQIKEGLEVAKEFLEKLNTKKMMDSEKK